MSRGPNYIEREVFEDLIADVPRTDGTAYQDMDAVDGDMSWLVVAWLACTPLEEQLPCTTSWGGRGIRTHWPSPC